MILKMHRLADADVEKARRHLTRHAIHAVKPFLDAVKAALSRIEQLPKTGAPIYDVHRFMMTQRFRYVIYYRLFDNDFIKVFAVAHASRRPGYWLRRTRRD